MASGLRAIQGISAIPEGQSGHDYGRFPDYFLLGVSAPPVGRVIGLLFFVPWLYFVVRNRMSRSMKWLTFAALCLGGLQGAVGWWMVKSGLVDNPSVSHYRLATHLSLALFCAMYVLWLALSIFPGERRTTHKRGVHWTRLFVALVVVQIVYGAFMAGTRAGYMYQTFPLFNGQFFPSQAYLPALGLSNLVENLDMLNFIHRSLGWVVGGFGIWISLRLRKTVKTKSQSVRLNWVGILVGAQFVLGVGVVLVPGVPPLLGAAHQIGAFALLATSVALLHSFRAQTKASVL